MSSANDKKIVVLGTGGHATVVGDILLLLGYEIYACVGSSPPNSKVFDNCLYIPTDENLVSILPNDEVWLVNGLGLLPSTKHIRSKVIEFYETQGYEFISVISPTALISPFSNVEQGAQILDRAVVHAETRVGKHTIVNTAAIVEHHCVIGCSVHIAPNSTVCGGVKVGDFCHVGAGSVVIQGVEIGSNSLVGAGAVLTKSIGENSKVYGFKTKIKA